MKPRDFVGDLLTIIIVCMFALAGAFYFIHRPCYDQLAIQAIVGEASNQRYFTMLCVAEAIRNRGNLKGVYGTHADHIWTEPTEVWSAATSAWQESKTSYDYTHGAENWGTWDDLVKEGETAAFHIQCGDLYFY